LKGYEIDLLKFFINQIKIWIQNMFKSNKKNAGEKNCLPDEDWSFLALEKILSMHDKIEEKIKRKVFLSMMVKNNLCDFGLTFSVDILEGIQCECKITLNENSYLRNFPVIGEITDEVILKLVKEISAWLVSEIIGEDSLAAEIRQTISTSQLLSKRLSDL
jgi:hypothetical protein